MPSTVGSAQRPSCPSIRRSALAALAGVAVLTAACPRPPPPPPPPPSLISVDVVDAADEAAGPAVVAALRESLLQAAETLGRDSRLERRLVISGSVSTFERVREGRRLTIRCEVSLSVRDGADGRILAMPRGWVQSRGDAPRDESAAAGLDRDVVRDAAANALARLATVIGDL